MKAIYSILLPISFALATPSPAQEKPSRKTMVFQPGAKTPDGHAEEAETPTPPSQKTAATTPARNVSGDLPAQMVSTFFTQLQGNQVEQAYAGLMKGSKIAEQPDQIKNLKLRTNEALSTFGSIVGFDLVESKSVGPHLVRRTYLTLGKSFPLRWRFYFYLPGPDWCLLDLRVDDRLTGMFDEKEEVPPAK